MKGVHAECRQFNRTEIDILGHCGKYITGSQFMKVLDYLKLYMNK